MPDEQWLKKSLALAASFQPYGVIFPYTWKIFLGFLLYNRTDTRKKGKDDYDDAMMIMIIPILFFYTRSDQAILKKLSGIQNKFDLYLSVHFTVSIIFSSWSSPSSTSYLGIFFATMQLPHTVIKVIITKKHTCNFHSQKDERRLRWAHTFFVVHRYIVKHSLCFVCKKKCKSINWLISSVNIT